MGKGMVCYFSKKNEEAKTSCWKKEMPQLLWTEGWEKRCTAVDNWSQGGVWEYGLTMDRKREMQWGAVQNKPMKFTVTRKIHYRVSTMWKLNMTHSWEGGQRCLYPDLQLNYVSKKFNISFVDLVTSILVVCWGFSGFLQAKACQCVYSFKCFHFSWTTEIGKIPMLSSFLQKGGCPLYFIFFWRLETMQYNYSSKVITA